MLHSVFLRSGCALPGRVDPLREHFCDNWTHVEKIEASDFDVMIRRAGWHFMWVQGSCSRNGYALTEKSAIDRALARALRGINKRFNAAEFDSLRISRLPGFYIASVTMEARQIQQNTSLDIVDVSDPRAIPARSVR
jgi:hypothetical protein